MTWPPNYEEVYKLRQERLNRLLSNGSEFFPGAKLFYQDHPAEFIEHWCVTYDPRKVASGASARLPFILFPRQRAFIEFLHGLVKAEANGLTEKCRDMGATWLCCSFSVWAWLFLPGASIGWGSRKQELVDHIGDPDSIFEKMRMLIKALPRAFWPAGFNDQYDMSFMRIINPESGASITGEIGDNIGRGGRKMMYFKDESAHYEHPEAIEAALTDNTKIQVDISSVHGVGTVFERKRVAGVDWAPGQPIIQGKTNVFVFDWRDHPEKTQAWYDQRRKKASDEGLLHIFAQEVERDYSASLEGVVIPAIWARAAIDAHKKLGFDDSGGWCAGLDVADGVEGGDTNALAVRKGIVLKSCEEWGGLDTGETTRKAISTVRELGDLDLQYDCIGVGSGVKAEVNRLSRLEKDIWPPGLRFVPWNAGDEVLRKDEHFIPHDRNSPLNGDLFTNLKAQAWWAARRRFELTYRAIRKIAVDATEEEQKFTYRVDDLISLSSEIPSLFKLVKELSQATVSLGSRLKMVIDKKPEGSKSPNNADAVVMCYFPVKTAMRIAPDALLRASKITPGRIPRPPTNRARL